MFQDNGLISGINKDRISNERLVYIKQPNSPCVCLFGWLVVAGGAINQSNANDIHAGSSQEELP